MKLLRDLIDAALVHQGAYIRYDGNGDVAQHIPVPPAVTRSLNIHESYELTSGQRALSARELKAQRIVGRVATLPANDNLTVGQRAAFLPSGTAASKQTVISTAVLERSLAAQAGATIITISEAPDVNAQNPGRRKAAYATVEAGVFQVVDDGDDLPASVLPVKRADWDPETVPSVGIRFDLTRSQLRDLSDGVTTDAVWFAILAGLANSADKVLLEYLAAATLPTFSLANVAGRGLRFDELRAIAGTSATGAAVGADGILRANGVRAELTNQAATTVIGAFDRAAVAIHEDIRVTAMRNLQGGVEIVCWANLEALVPDLTAFWKAA